MSGRRPWWASDGPVNGGVDVTEDPVERFRASRRGPTGYADDVPVDDVPVADVPVDDVPPPGGADPDTQAGTAAGAGPWWDAAVDAVSRLADGVAATAEAHGRGVSRDPDAGGPDDEPSDGPGDGASRGAGPPHHIDACGVCPVCAGIRALGESRPELVTHLAEAARHVALAARSLAPRPGGAAGTDEPLQRIDLDD